MRLTLLPVVGVAGQDGVGTIQLFGEHRAGQEVGPGCGAEAHDEIGCCAGLGDVAVCGA